VYRLLQPISLLSSIRTCPNTTMDAFVAVKIDMFLIQAIKKNAVSHQMETTYGKAPDRNRTDIISLEG
jgi:hypothetical protein